MTDMVHGLCEIIGNIKMGGGFSLVRSSKGVALQKLNLDRIGDRGMSRVYALWNVYKMGGGSVEMGDSPTYNTYNR